MEEGHLYASRGAGLTARGYWQWDMAVPASRVGVGHFRFGDVAGGDIEDFNFYPGEKGIFSLTYLAVFTPLICQGGSF